MEIVSDCLEAVQRQRDLNSCKENFFEKFGNAEFYEITKKLVACKSDVSSVRSEINLIESKMTSSSNQDLVKVQNKTFAFHKILEAMARNFITKIFFAQ